MTQKKATYTCKEPTALGNNDVPGEQSRGCFIGMVTRRGGRDNESKAGVLAEAWLIWGGKDVVTTHASLCNVSHPSLRACGLALPWTSPFVIFFIVFCLFPGPGIFFLGLLTLLVSQ